MPHDSCEATGGSRLAAAAWLAVVLAVAAALRLWGIKWGLPDETHLFSYHPDEFHSLRAALAMAAGDPNPHFFNYGSLYLYVVGFVCLWHTALSGNADLLTALAKGDSAHAQMAAWTLDARLVVVACGVATVYVVWLIGHRLGGLRGAAWAGGLMAVFALHVLNSHYATVDVPQTLFITLCLYFSLRLMDEPNWRSYLLAGVSAGLAASVKYNGVLVIVAPLVAHFARAPVPPNSPDEAAGRGGWVWPVVMVGAVGIAFAVTSPYVLLSWPEAWGHIRFEIEHMRLGEWPMRAVHPNGWVFHLHPSLLLMAGALALARGDRRRLLPCALFGAVWFVMIGAAGVRYARYAMALEPLAAIFASSCILSLRRSWRPEVRWAGALAAGLWGSGLLFMCAQRNEVMTSRDVRDEMLATVLRVVPEGETVATIWEPWFNVAPVDYCNGGAALRSMPLFARFKRPVRPLAVMGMDAERIRAARPYAVLVSEFELDNRFRDVSQEHSSVYRLLWESREFGSPQYAMRPFLVDHPVLLRTASDSRYPAPNLFLFIRADAGEEGSDPAGGAGEE